MEFVLREAEFQTVASETIRGVNSSNKNIDRIRTRGERLFPRWEISCKELEESITRVNGRYQEAIPWKDDGPVLPDNYKMAPSNNGDTDCIWSLCKVQRSLFKWRHPSRAENAKSTERCSAPFSKKPWSTDVWHCGDVLENWSRARRSTILAFSLESPESRREAHRVRIQPSCLWPKLLSIPSPICCEDAYGETKRLIPMSAETVLKSTYKDDTMDSVANDDQGFTKS